MTSNSKSSALDDLMLAYTDLSGNSKKSAFKGPPVKDIRREAPKQVFQHSNKARDWRAFDQSLESVFGSSSVQVPSPALAPVQAGGSGEGEEWGDFQQFSVSQSLSVGSRSVVHVISVLLSLPSSTPDLPPSKTRAQCTGSNLLRLNPPPWWEIWPASAYSRPRPSLSPGLSPPRSWIMTMISETSPAPPYSLQRPHSQEVSFPGPSTQSVPPVDQEGAQLL